MEEKQQIILANQDGGTVPGAAPTFFVILKQPGNGKTDQGILVTNRDACALASSVSSPGKSKGKICLPADCTVGGITVTLDNNNMWNEFYHRSTEMILTKQGRRMFPYCRYWITGLDSNMKYILVMDISPVDNHRYKWNGRWWEPSGKAEPHVLGRVFIHPESPSTGHYWMHQPVSFYKLKLTNNTLDQEGHIILHSMHRYLPRLHLVPAEKATEVIQLNGPGVHTFTFPQTEFFAVTAYQNIQITQLKIDYNPFAKGFRDDGLNSKPQRDGKQKNSSDQEGNSVPSSPGQRVRLTEGEGSEVQLTDLDPLSRGQETSGKGLEKPSLNIKRDFLGFMDIDSALGEVPQLKQEVSESLGNSFEDGSHVTSPLNPNENFNVVIKEEPLDDYEYELGECPEGVTVKQEETDEETDVYSNSDDDPILEKQLKRHNKADNLEADHPSSKWQPNSPSGVAKAKMFKLDAGKMPVVYLEPCAVTKSTVKVSELPDNMLSTSRKDRSLLTELDYLPAYVENSNETGFCLGRESENDLGRHSLDIRVVQKYPSLKEAQWKYPDISDSVNTEKLLDGSKSSVGDSFLGKEDLGRKKTMLKISAAPKTVNANQNAPPNVPGKRGRPRKLKLSKAGRPPKNTGRSLTSTKNTLTGPGSTFPDVKPDLEDVDGVLFVSFESKEALDIHAVDGTNEESCSLQASAANDPGCRARISQLEKELIEDLKALRHKQVIHPGLQEVGLKLNSVDPTMSIDLKYLGVQLPLAPATSFPFWNLTGANPASPDAGFPFVSRTGKTNDFTKIKGWRGKFHSASASRNEGGNSEGPLKNRSAFCSDKLDEYLENEGKLMETSMGFSSNAPTSPVVYQLPTKSTSYVRTLDSVLKKQSTISPSTSYSLKPHSVPSVSRKAKSQNKQATFSGRTKSSYKSILPYPVSPKQKHTPMIPGDKITKNSSSTTSENRVNNLIVPTLDENTFPKQISLRQAHQQQQQQQQQQGSRPPGLSKSQVKLMDLEDCALWEGKPRTYITEERADVSLTTLLTAQASLKTKPIHTIIRKRAPPCNNDFCRLGCVCSSLALEKRQPAHCRRPDCMFGCTCLKRKVVLVKGGSKTKHFQKKSAHRDPVFYDNLGEEQKEEGEEGVKEEEEQLKEKKKRKKLEYTICETEPEQPVRHYPLWVKVEGEVDPEPVYIPTPSVIEPMKPLLLPQPEVLSTTVKGKLLTGIKPARAYTPKPNPVIREEDKDPVYLYFESMMTCARVRVYERKKEEERQPSPSPSPSFQQQGSCHSSPENCSVKEPASEQQPLKPLTCDLEDDSDKSQEKSWKSSCNEGESASTSYVHQRSPGGPTKLIEIISDCNWEEDRNKILSILSQHINSNMPQSLKVGSFIIELASQRKSRGEKNPPVYSSRVKISMPSCQDQDDMAEKSGSETPDGPLSPGKMDDVSPVQTDALDSVRERLHGGKGLPFYAGLSPAGKLVAYKRKPSSSTSGLIQVNGKSYPQAKLLLGQMGALHPANRLAAYITGRLRPSVLDLSTLSTVISKVASNAKVAASRKPRTLLPSTSNSKTASSSGTTTNRPGKNLKAFVPAKRPIENAPQIPVAPPQVSPNTVKRAGPRLLLIPVQQGSPTLRPVPNTQLQGHRMVLQPVRSPSGMNLFRHPNGQIVQLLPLHQLRGSNNQPNLQPVMFRNPGSVMGIRLPTPSKPSETPPSSASPSAFSVVNPVIQAVGSSPAMNVITQAPSLLSSGPNFVSQSGTLTLRISPPEPHSFTSKTASETKITYSSGGQPVGTASLIPLQSGSFALLQLPGQKPVPSSILQHVASLQMKRESQNADQKDETSFLKREQETKKVLQSGEAVEPETNIIKQNSGAAVSEETLNDSLEDRGDHLDEESLIEEGPTAVKPSEHVCSTGSHAGEDYKDVEEEYGIRNHNSSKEKLTVLEVKTISGRASNMTVQSVNNVQLKKLGDVKVEQQKGLDNPEEKSNEFPVISKEESKVEFSGSRVAEQQSNPKPEAKEKECGESLEKDSIKERWRKHLKGPLAQKYVRTSQEGKNETNEQLIKETKTCKENSDVFQQEHSISDLLGKSGTTENARILKTECDSWSRISSPTTFSIVPRRAAKGSKGDGHFQGHLLLSGEQIKPKQEKTGGRSSTDFTVLELEEEDEEDENEKTDDSIDEIVDVVSDYQSEEVDDVEKNNCIEYIEDDEEQVDIETVEELPEEIKIAHMKSTAVHTEILKQPCCTPVSADEKATERSRKAAQVPLKLKPDYWSEKLQKEAEAFAYYRRTHTANERRRRGEMRDLFEKLKITLGLLHSSKVSKSLILTRAFSEIQGLTDQADKLIGQKNLLTRKRNILIRKVSSLSGKTEEVVLKKLEYIYAKQQAVEAQKRKKKMGSDEFDVSPRTSKQQEGASVSSVDLGQMFINNRKGKPLILSRKKDQATENTSPSNTPHTSANIVMTPQGQLLTLKGPLFSGPVVTVSPALLEGDLKPQVASSAVAQSENDDLFMMPRIVNVTSLATEGGLVDMSGSKYPHEVPDGKPPDHLKNTVRSEDNSCEDLGRISSRGNHRDVRMTLGTAQVYLSHKDSGFPQIVDVSSMQEAQEFLPKKISGDTRGSQHKWKESESRRERLKTKESPFHKLKMKDLKDSSIEMELRKVASAIEEAALDPSELLTSMEDEDDTDETLTSLLNEIAFLNQQLNDDSVSLAELPSSLDTEFPGDARRAFISKLPPGNRATFQVGHLETGLKELPDVQGESDSVSPLLLHLEDDDFSENEKQLAEPASEPDVLKIVIDSEIKDPLVSQRKAGDEGKSASGVPAEPESVSSPPVLHMKGGLENSSTDTLWRPMPKLAPLGLKVANPSSDTEGQSLKVMPCLAPVAAKVGSVGHKMNLTGNDQECRESKVMPTLAPVVAKLGNTGASPSSAGK
ncbi:MAX gene-associated protein isoform X6 [Bos indicus x Bos taurus]|uniref:MAX gene-associated protein isoform X6 n=1 Tax=Bos indicus x Bos taurus TaxID=30522 RepID=UPI000952C396|nr:PREDICTED: MAX gene-associated protein isoform X6 [Bos indicus]XP_027409412.1 MAX gene-associated protein isoform X6 [Bos indicus x Bos taurus]